MLEIARLLYQSSCLYETGTLYINTGDEQGFILLRYGYVCAIHAGRAFDLDPLQKIKILLQRGTSASFQPQESSYQEPSLFPFHPALIIRQYVETFGNLSSSVPGYRKSQWIQLSVSPHSSCISSEEQFLVRYLMTPRTIDEIELHSFLGRTQLYRFLEFLRQMGTLSIGSDGMVLREEYRLLGLTPPVTIEQIKTAYRSLIRKFHPDFHPNANMTEFQALTAQFIQIHNAYQRLIEEFQ